MENAIPTMTSVLEALTQHISAPFPPSIERGRRCGSIDPVQVDAAIVGWVDAAISGYISVADLHLLDASRIAIASSWYELAMDARPYFARLLHLADAVMQRCDDLPMRPAQLPDGLDDLARIVCNGEVMWHRDQVVSALRALSANGDVIVGLDFRTFAQPRLTSEAPWSSFDGTAGLDANLQEVLASLERSNTVGLGGRPWVLVTY